MPTFQKLLPEDNNNKEPESHEGQNVNSKKEGKQEILIPYKSQKVNVKKEKHPTFKA